jgi:DNA-directed RNA polymerase subunit beta
VGTGLEERDRPRLRHCVIRAEAPGKVAYVSGSKIIASVDGEEATKKTPRSDFQSYDLRKFMRSNAGTCINQKPIVKGDRR